MLFELLPHFARLMPMADKYLSTRSASEKAQEAALAALAVEVRGEMGRGTDAQAGLLRQMQEQSVQIGDLALDLTRARMGVEELQVRIEKLEQSMERQEARSAHAAKVLIAVLTVAVISAGLLLVLTIYVVVRPGH